MTRGCEFIDAVRAANAGAHKENGRLRNVRHGQLLTARRAAGRGRCV